MLRKIFLLCLTIVLGINAFSQIDSVDVVFHWNDETIPPSTAFENTYNEVWGFVQNDHEFAVIGTTLGTHIFDITDTENVEQVAFIEGAEASPAVVHRDYHDYNGYLYAVCGERYNESTLQIIDISQLPDTFSVAYDSNELFGQCHNIFIDTMTAKLYACAVVHPDPFSVSKMLIYALDDPLQPELIYEHEEFLVHDIYVRNDTAYLNCEENGLFVMDFTDMESPELIGSLTDYFEQGYNHSGWLSDDGNTYFMTDETLASDVKIVDVSDLSDINVVAHFDAGVHEGNIPHNPMSRGDYLFMAYYYDGLQVFDVSDPANPIQVRTYSTSNIPHSASYEGAWGVYCNLPSGNIILSDMQEGLFVFNVNLDLPPIYPIDTMVIDTMQIDTMEIDTMEIDTTGVGLYNNSINEIDVYPSIFSNTIFINTSNIEFTLDNRTRTVELYNLDGQVIYKQTISNNNTNTNDIIKLNIPNKLISGMYILKLFDGKNIYTKKLVKK